ncbi:hypothetical protein I4U23_001861 [Adineta vaga]|nr:hypothetical protein I4U23_001861 [Adineta vaga]
MSAPFCSSTVDGAVALAYVESTIQSADQTKLITSQPYQEVQKRREHLRLFRIQHNTTVS